MRRRDHIYPINDGDISSLNVATAAAGFGGAAASFCFSRAFDLHLQASIVAVADDATRLQKARLEDMRMVGIILGVVFVVVAIVGWGWRGSTLNRIKRDCTPV